MLGDQQHIPASPPMSLSQVHSTDEAITTGQTSSKSFFSCYRALFRNCVLVTSLHIICILVVLPATLIIFIIYNFLVYMIFGTIIDFHEEL